MLVKPQHLSTVIKNNEEGSTASTCNISGESDVSNRFHELESDRIIMLQRLMALNSRSADGSNIRQFGSVEKAFCAKRP